MGKRGVLALTIALGVVIFGTAAIFGYRYFNNNNYVAIINGEKVSTQEFNFMLGTIKDNITQKYGVTDFNQIIDGKKYYLDTAKEQALESIEGYKLGAQQAAKKGITLSDKEIKDMNNNFQNLLKQNPIINQRLQQAGLSVKEFQDIYKEMTLSGKIISDKDAQDYYNKNKQNYVYQEDTARARHILFKTVDDNNNPLPQAQQDQAKAKAEQILQRAKAGEDFALLAKQYSEDGGSKDNGGEYVFPRGQMVKEFEDAAFSMKPGQISDLVKTKYGYHIIKLEVIYKKGDQMSFEDVKSTILSDLYNKSLEQWKKDSQIIKNDKIYNSIS